MKQCNNPDCPDIKNLGLKGEYEDSVDVCPKCGAKLRPIKRKEQKEEPHEHVPEDYEFAARITNEALIPLAKSILENAGIAFVTKNELVQHLFAYGSIGTGFNPITGEVEFWVDRERVEEARELLSELTK